MVHNDIHNAKVDADDVVRYYDGNIVHRAGAPAEYFPDGTVKYRENGKLHRKNGPAVIYADGTEEYWLSGAQYSLSEFLDITNTPVVLGKPDEPGKTVWHQNGQHYVADDIPVTTHNENDWWVKAVAHRRGA